MLYHIVTKLLGSAGHHLVLSPTACQELLKGAGIRWPHPILHQLTSSGPHFFLVGVGGLECWVGWTRLCNVELCGVIRIKYGFFWLELVVYFIHLFGRIIP